MIMPDHLNVAGHFFITILLYITSQLYSMKRVKTFLTYYIRD